MLKAWISLPDHRNVPGSCSGVICTFGMACNLAGAGPNINETI